MSLKGTEFTPLCVPMPMYKCRLIPIFVYKEVCICNRKWFEIIIIMCMCECWTHI